VIDVSRATAKAKIFKITLCIVLLAAVLANVHMIEGSIVGPARENWIDYAADGFAGGKGTEDDPYQIATAEQLAYLAKIVNDKIYTKEVSQGNYFELISDINLEGKEWTPIGHYKGLEAIMTELRNISIFTGNFNGNNKTIKNLTIRNLLTEAGLFGYLFRAKVSNIQLQNINIFGYVSGGIAGKSYLSEFFNSSISGRIVSPLWAGGIVAEMFQSSILNCTVDAVEEDIP
jgi:hypothetical protein